jgi:hypothetical protein
MVVMVRLKIVTAIVTDKPIAKRLALSHISGTLAARERDQQWLN